MPEQAEASHDTNEFLRDVLGPYSANAPKSNQERYDNDRKHSAPKEVHVTDGGKEIHVDQDASGKFFVKFVPGGEMPQELKGLFTREDLAHQAIKVYLANK